MSPPGWPGRAMVNVRQSSSPAPASCAVMKQLSGWNRLQPLMPLITRPSTTSGPLELPYPWAGSAI